MTPEQQEALGHVRLALDVWPENPGPTTAAMWLAEVRRIFQEISTAFASNEGGQS